MKLLFVIGVLAIVALAYAQEPVQMESEATQPEGTEVQEDTVPRFKRQFGYGQFGGYSGIQRGLYPPYGGGFGGGGFGRPRTVVIKKVILG